MGLLEPGISVYVGSRHMCLLSSDSFKAERTRVLFCEHGVEQRPAASLDLPYNWGRKVQVCVCIWEREREMLIEYTAVTHIHNLFLFCNIEFFWFSSKDSLNIFCSLTSWGKCEREDMSGFSIDNDNRTFFEKNILNEWEDKAKDKRLIPDKIKIKWRLILKKMIKWPCGFHISQHGEFYP